MGEILYEFNRDPKIISGGIFASFQQQHNSVYQINIQAFRYHGYYCPMNL